MQNSTILKAEDFYKGVSGECLMVFTEYGYNIIKDTRTPHKHAVDHTKVWKEGYLHIFEDSAEEITEACRNQIIKYFFCHKTGEMPGLGMTVTERYFKGLTRGEAEKIGNGGKKAYYNY